MDKRFFIAPLIIIGVGAWLLHTILGCAVATVSFMTAIYLYKNGGKTEAEAPQEELTDKFNVVENYRKRVGDLLIRQREKSLPQVGTPEWEKYHKECQKIDNDYEQHFGDNPMGCAFLFRTITKK